MTDDDTPQIPEPRENPLFLGHDAAEAAVHAAIESGRMPHAWLLSGPRGIGKATLAFRAARYLLAGGGADRTPDLLGGTGAAERLHVPADSLVFRNVAAGGHPNLRILEVSPDSKSNEIPVDVVRALNRFFRSTAWEPGWRVAIVDPAEALNRSAVNAILKIVEEPPKKSAIFLISHTPGALLPTLRSRCRQLIMRPIADGPLQSLLAELRPDLDAERLAAVAPLAEGSPGRALTLLEGGGLEIYDALGGLLQKLPELDIGELHAFAQKGAKRNDSPDRFAITASLIDWILARIVRRAAGLPPAGEQTAPAFEIALAARIEGPAALDRWAQLWENTRRLLRGAENASLDREKALLETFFELQAAARR